MTTTLDPGTRAHLVGVFVAEAEETLLTLAVAFERLRSAADAEALATFGRSAHGLKGAAASVGLDALAQVLHKLEDASLRLGDRATHAAAYERIDRALQLLGQVIAQMAASGRDEPPAEIVQDVLELLSEGAAAAPGSRAAPAPSSQQVHPPEKPPTAPAGPAPAADTAAERLSVPAADVDEALRLAASLARGITSFQDVLQRGEGGPAASLQTLAAAAERLEAMIAGLRLLPAEIALSGIERETEQLAERLGKRVELVIEGRDVRADRRSLQAARVMIRHLIRNALDHGIETPEQRASVGKPAAGRLTVRLDAFESSLRVTVEDDGAGFDLPAIRAEMAQRRGEAEAIAQLSDRELLELFASEGGSTRATTTEVSGRGLGLSAVTSMARDAGGAVEVRTRCGAGSRIGFTLPLEMFATEVLATRASGRLLGIPIRSVQRSVHLHAAREAVQSGPSGLTLAIDEVVLPLCDLGRILDGAAPSLDLPPFAAVVQEEGSAAAFAIEEVGTVMGVVPVTVPGVAEPGALVTGVAQLANGAVLEILNPKRLLALARAAPRLAEAAGTRQPAAESPLPAGQSPLEVVLAEDSLSTREVLRVLLEQQGFRVRLAADGEEALARIAEKAPDVLVTDINMPRRDGLWLTRQLRARPDTARLPVVLLTSQEDATSQAAGAAAGADAYLMKSRFNAAVLAEALSRIGVRSRK